MTSYELVRRAIEFDNPERVPVEFRNLDFSDTYDVGYKAIEDEWKPGQRYRKDEWGCVWERPGENTGIENMGMPKVHPLKDLNKLKEYRFPDPEDPRRYEDIDKSLVSYENKDKYAVVSWFNLYERAWYLHGMAELFIDLYENPQLIHELLNGIKDFILGVLANLRTFQGRIHGFYMGDDWGTQQGSQISLPLFRQFFKPCYREIFNEAHDMGMHVWLHSCGKVNEIIEEFIDIGLDVINLQQPRLLGIDEISERYAGRICFECPVDIQRTLPSGSKEEIEEEAAMLIRKWGKPGGGFIGADYGDNSGIGVTEERVRIMLEAFLKHGSSLLEEIEE